MTVTVEPDLFDAIGEPDGEGWEGSPAFLVVANDVAGAAAALHAAGERFMLIDEHGRELAEWESDTGETYTPNYVSDVGLSERGPVLWVDTKGYLTAAMGAAMVQALTEELTARGVTAHVTTPPHGLSSARLPQWQPPAAAPQGAPSGPEVPKTWFVCRSVERTTTDGRPYGDTEYRAADGTWDGGGRPPSGLPSHPVSSSTSSAPSPGRPAEVRSTACSCRTTTASGTPCRRPSCASRPEARPGARASRQHGRSRTRPPAPFGATPPVVSGAFGLGAGGWLSAARAVVGVLPASLSASGTSAAARTAASRVPSGLRCSPGPSGR
jgi:hypothetical protein